MTILKYSRIKNALLIFIKTGVLNKNNREMDTVKWESSGTTYILLNGKNSVHMSLTKLNDID